MWYKINILMTQIFTRENSPRIYSYKSKLTTIPQTFSKRSPDYDRTDEKDRLLSVLKNDTHRFLKFETTKFVSMLKSTTLHCDNKHDDTDRNTTISV